MFVRPLFCAPNLYCNITPVDDEMYIRVTTQLIPFLQWMSDTVPIQIPTIFRSEVLDRCGITNRNVLCSDIRQSDALFAALASKYKILYVLLPRH